MQGHCAAHAQRVEAAKRDARYSATVAGLPPEAKAAFAKLRAAAAKVRTSRGEEETDMSGTARGAMAVESEEDFEKGFGEVLDAVAKGTLPSADAAVAARADAALNAAYRKALHAKRFGTVTPDGIRATERLWLPYRDAWLTFAKAAYPKTDADALSAELSKRRTAELAELAE